MMKPKNPSTLQTAMAPGSKMDSAVSTTIKNLVDLLMQILLNNDEEVNGGNGGDKARNLKSTCKPQMKQ